jgi:hypothetical protein
MNLHGIVRGAINSVNADRSALYLRSTGNTVNADFSQTPTYAPGVPVRIQVQPLGKEELRHVEKLNMQGVFRTVFMYGNTQGVVRVLLQGGDLLQFAPFQGQAFQNWKVVGPVDGPWNVEYGGWTKVLVQLQTDMPTPIPESGP